MIYEYAQLLWYVVSGDFTNYSTGEGIISIKERHLPYALAELSAQGWLIVDVCHKKTIADNDWSIQYSLQREVKP